jgi:hypothetical protein
MAATVTLTVDGLVEFSRALHGLERSLPRALRLALNTSADVVIGRAQPRVPTLTGRAARSMHARSTRTKVRVTAGGDRAPYYPWLDFGGRVGHHGTALRAFLKEGRFLYPAYFELRRSGEFDKVLERELRKVAVQAGLAVD